MKIIHKKIHHFSFAKKSLLNGFYLFIIIINFSCQNIKDKKNSESPVITDFSEIKIDERPLLNFNMNFDYQLFNKIQNEIGLSMNQIKHKSKKFLNLSKFFYVNNGTQMIEEQYYYENKTISNLYKLEFNSRKLIGVSDIENNQLEIIYKYDKLNNLKEIIERHQYPDLTKTNKNKIQYQKGEKSIIHTQFNTENNILFSINYDESFENGNKIREVDSFYYFVSKTDPTLKIVRETNIEHLRFTKPSTFKHYVFKINKLIQCVEFNSDSTIFRVYDISYLEKNNIEIKIYEIDDSNSLSLSFKTIIVLDSEFSIQNIKFYKYYKTNKEITEKQFVYFYIDNELSNIQISKKNYILKDDEKMPNTSNFIKEKDFFRRK